MTRSTLLLLTISGLAATTIAALAGVKEKALYDLRPKEGGYAYGTPVFDAGGNLYATTFLGGKKGGGTLFQLSPSQTGKWSIRVLHDFGPHYDYNHPKDGDDPSGPLLFDPAGNLYGTTFRGGKYANPDTSGGTVYQLTPDENGQWTQTVLHDFANGQDAAEPNGGVIADASGNLYGTSEIGGSLTGQCASYGCGAVFELSPGSNGKWSETVLYAFTGAPDGISPYGGLVVDTAGNLYGTTIAGGANGGGTVFEVSPGTDGQWTETVLYSFCALANCADGEFPFDGLVLDGAGNLYGTTDDGGVNADCSFGSTCGTVFEVSSSGGKWTESVLHSFDNSDGAQPDAGVVFDAAGNLYGAPLLGGGTGCGGMGCGTVIELQPAQNGAWSEKTLHVFQNGTKDGAGPYGGLVLDSAGSVYGVTEQGPGTACFGQGCGVVFQLTP